MIKRFLEETLKIKLEKGKTIIIMGARQVGKTTLIKNDFKRQEGCIMAKWR